MDHCNNGAPPLRVENVTKRFFQGDVVIEALRGVSLEVQRGEFVAVMGASGSGKSTLLHVIAGLTRPDEGRVLVDDVDLAVMSDRGRTELRRRRIGLVFQAFNLIPTLTAEQNILLPIFSDGRRAAEDGRLDSLMTSLALRSRRYQRPDTLSGGEQQRVAIARALVTNPSILLADEPTGSLDSVAGQQLCRLLKEQSEANGRTIIVVTHEPTVATWANRVVVLKDGCVLSEFGAAEFHDAHALAAHYHDVVGSSLPTEGAQ
jgi:putative ABC transport system ATP-binding protein